MQRLFTFDQIHSGDKSLIRALVPDIVLHLSDREVYCHSTVLRARSEFFADFFDEDEWTKRRWDANGVLSINMKHLEWRVMDYVLKFICFGEEGKMFDSLGFLNTADDVLDFMFDVMAAAVSSFHYVLHDLF